MDTMDMKSQMNKSIEHLRERFSKIRAGRASLDILSDIKVDYYGSEVPLNQAANMTILDARTISITPWEKSLVIAIEKAITKANLGVNPSTDGDSVKIVLPSLTEERRKEFVKQAKKELEECKIGLRGVRHKFHVLLKDLTEDEAEREEKKIQKTLDEYNKLADELFAKKEKDILTI